MAEEVILTRFVGDTASLDAAIDAAIKDMKTFDESVVKADADTKKLDATLGSASGKFLQLGASTKDLKTVSTDIGGIGKAAETSSAGVGTLTGRIKTGFTGATASVKGFATKGIASVGGFFANVKAGLPNLQGIGQAFQGATSSVGGFAGTALSALGPVGIAVGALAGGLLKIAANTDAGATAIDGFGRTGGIVFDKITGQVSGFFDRLTSGDSAFGKFAAGFIDASRVIINALVPIEGALKAIGLTDAFTEAAKDGQTLAQVYDNIDEAQTANISTNAKLERQIGQLNIQLRDRTKTDAERLAIGEQIDTLEGQRVANELKVLKVISSAKRAEAALELRDKGEVSDETKRALAEALAAEDRAAQGSEQITERTQNRINAITDAAQAKRQASAEKAQAAAAKLAQEEEARAQKVAVAEQRATDIVNEARSNRIESGLSDNEKEVFAVEERYAKEVAAATKAFDELKALNAGNLEEQTRIAELQKQTIIDINAAKAAELEAIEVEQLAKADELRNADVELVKAATLSKADIEREAINKRFDEATAAAERTITDEEDLTAKLVEIQQQRGAELALVQDEQAIKETERLKAEQEQRVAILTATGDQLAGLVEGIASGQIKTAEEAGKALALIALDTLEKTVLMSGVQITAGTTAGGATTGGPAGAVAGLAQGLALTALIKALFAGIKGLITANYQGDPFVGGDGSTPTWAGRDGYLRRLDKGERVVTGRTNKKHFGLFEAAEKDRVEDYVAKFYGKIGYDDANIRASAIDIFGAFNGDMSKFIAADYAPKVNGYMDSDDGRRTLSMTFPKYFDKNIVESSRASRKEQAKTNELLSMLIDATAKEHRPHPRYGR